MIKVLVIGAKGKMGSETIKAINCEKDLELVGAIDINDKLGDIIDQKKPDVAVDFTNPSVVKNNILQLLDKGVYPVVGTTGLTETDLAEIDIKAKEKKIACLICPNFAIGAVLMMKYAQDAAKYLQSVEIIELHHNQKADSPSGTAIKTAEMIAISNKNINSDLEALQKTEKIKGVRGGTKERIPIHSVRLQGFVAHQEVIFGGLGQTLSLRHDTINRESFMPGVIIAISKAQTQSGLVYGLEKIL